MHRQKRLNIPPAVELALRCGYAMRKRVMPSSGGETTVSAETVAEPVSTSQLHRILARLGIHAGSTLIVHSDSRGIADIGWELSDFLDCLLEYLGPGGTLVMPSHPRLRQQNGKEIYNPRRSPSRVGMLTELFRRRREVVRSRFPFSAAAAIGPLARTLLESHADSFAPHDERSPYARLADHDAVSLCIGCPLDRMTILHVAEDVGRDELNIPGFHVAREVWIEDQGELQRTVAHTRAPWLWWYLSLYQWTYRMYRQSLVSECAIHRVPFRAAGVKPTVEWMHGELRQGRSLYPLARANRLLQLGPPTGEKAA